MGDRVANDAVPARGAIAACGGCSSSARFSGASSGRIVAGGRPCSCTRGACSGTRSRSCCLTCGSAGGSRSPTSGSTRGTCRSCCRTGRGARGARASGGARRPRYRTCARAKGSLAVFLGFVVAGATFDRVVAAETVEAIVPGATVEAVVPFGPHERILAVGADEDLSQGFLPGEEGSDHHYHHRKQDV